MPSNFFGNDMTQRADTIFRLILCPLLALCILAAGAGSVRGAAQPLDRGAEVARFAPGVMGSAIGAADLTQRVCFKFSDRASLIALIPGRPAVVWTGAFCCFPPEAIDRPVPDAGTGSVAIRAPPR
jgi:hypothetical protein